MHAYKPYQNRLFARCLLSQARLIKNDDNGLTNTSCVGSTSELLILLILLILLLLVLLLLLLLIGEDKGEPAV